MTATPNQTRRCRANVAHVTQSGQYSGLGFQVKALETSQSVDSSLGNARQRDQRGRLATHIKAEPTASKRGGNTFKHFQGLLPESKGENLAWTVLYVPYLLEICF